MQGNGLLPSRQPRPIPQEEQMNDSRYREGWNMRRSGLLFLMTLALLIGQRPLAAVAAEGSDWDRQSAAEFLDNRMDAWFSRADRLRTGAATASCVSCHTAVP